MVGNLPRTWIPRKNDSHNVRAYHQGVLIYIMSKIRRAVRKERNNAKFDNQKRNTQQPFRLQVFDNYYSFHNIDSRQHIRYVPGLLSGPGEL